MESSAFELKPVQPDTAGRGADMVDTKLEVVILPVSDVERAKRFYEGLGWRKDADFSRGDEWRALQFTPPGSPCSVIFGKGVTSAAPGSVQGNFLIVDDIEAARAELNNRGAKVGEPFHFEGDLSVTGTKGRAPGRDPQNRTYSTWASFSDPDGNGWLLQEITMRLPGRGFSTLDVKSLTELLRESEEHHGEYERTAPKHHWSGWYAAYIVARQRGRTPEEAAKDAARHMEGAR
jgi:predicted enzyme related to lactoylglutathione lyase